jgi:hypothetical protein
MLGKAIGCCRPTEFSGALITLAKPLAFGPGWMREEIQFVVSDFIHWIKGMQQMGIALRDWEKRGGPLN